MTHPNKHYIGRVAGGVRAQTMDWTMDNGETIGAMLPPPSCQWRVDNGLRGKREKTNKIIWNLSHFFYPSFFILLLNSFLLLLRQSIFFRFPFSVSPVSLSFRQVILSYSSSFILFFPISSVSFCEHLTAPIPLLSTFPFLSSSVYLPFLSFFYGYEYMCILLFPSQFFSPYTFIYRIYVYLYLQYTFIIDLRRTVHKAAHTPLSSVYID